VTNQLIRQALHPYSHELCIVTKVSARRDEKGNWLPAMSPTELTQAVEDNLNKSTATIFPTVESADATHAILPK
jgi:aryl-alcohol dehydrogenase-like predicted oxidoreductase